MHRVSRAFFQRKRSYLTLIIELCSILDKYRDNNADRDDETGRGSLPKEGVWMAGRPFTMITRPIENTRDSDDERLFANLCG